MDDENIMLVREVFEWIWSTSNRMETEQKCQHATRNFVNFSVVVMMDYNKDHGGLETTVYQINTKQLQDQLSGAVPLFFEEGW